RLYREAPLNSIWEGSGNVTALDVLRALARTPGCADALLAELDLAAGGDRRLDAARGQLSEVLAGLEAATRPEAQYQARRPGGPGGGCGTGGAGGRTRSAARGSVPPRPVGPVHRSAPCRTGSTSGGSSIGPGSPPGPADAPLAGNSLPPGRDLGWRGHQLRA